ncbi:mitochondrial protein [Phytophthora palmivora]|uniref:Mitochondrial protein n=1 Tax=Phytophthora palmivora TaxID=4796 RepID=A0A2P4Y556_9STRA|nr:mitochondrial protein [Phytophthora palmivora]
MSMKTPRGIKKGVLTKVWHIPKLSRNLFSVGRFTKDVGPVTFERDGCFAETKKIKWQLGAREGKGLFKLCMTPIMPDEANVSSSKGRKGDTTSYLWHLRLGHIGHGGLDAIVKKGYGVGINMTAVKQWELCDGCALGKQHGVKRLKWDPKAREGIFLGYEEVSKAYRVYVIEAGKVMISRDVTFDEPTRQGFRDLEVDEACDYLEDLQISDDNGVRVYKQAGKRKSRSELDDHANVRHPRRRAGLEEASAPGTDSDNQDQEESSSSEEGKSEDNDSSTPPMFWRASANAVDASDSAEPKTFQEAVNGPDQAHWRKAIRAELKSMRLRGVFRAAKLNNNQRAVGTKKYGIDYTETFTPVVKYVTLRMIIAIAKYVGWLIDQLDVVTAFLYGLMKEKVFCSVPEGVELDDGFDCVELLKAIYGLKQDSRVWNETFDEYVRSIGFRVSSYDPCLYM